MSTFSFVHHEFDLFSYKLHIYNRLCIYLTYTYHSYLWVAHFRGGLLYYIFSSHTLHHCKKRITCPGGVLQYSINQHILSYLLIQSCIMFSIYYNMLPSLRYLFSNINLLVFYGKHIFDRTSWSFFHLHSSVSYYWY